MRNLRNETAEHFDSFSSAWQSELSSAIKTLSATNDAYLSSYQRLVSIQAWKSELVEQLLSPTAVAFFVESQNDGLTSHVLASMGIWRASLKSLRSCMENVLYCLYYKDHPIELALWETGKHRLTFSELHSYFVTHPNLSGIQTRINGLDILRVEYGKLSRAVHGTGETFRMTAETGSVQLSVADTTRLGMWQSRAKSTIKALNLLLLSMFRSELAGARKPNLRKAVSLAVPPSLHQDIQSSIGVALYS